MDHPSGHLLATLGDYRWLNRRHDTSTISRDTNIPYIVSHHIVPMLCRANFLIQAQPYGLLVVSYQHGEHVSLADVCQLRHYKNKSRPSPSCHTCYLHPPCRCYLRCMAKSAHHCTLCHHRWKWPRVTVVDLERGGDNWVGQSGPWGRRGVKMW